MKIIHPLKSFATLLLVAILAVGCASDGGDDTTGITAQEAIAAAKKANAKARAEGVEWRDTGKIIKKAEAALADGDSAKAIKLANQARRQAEMAVEQKYSELRRLRALGILGDDAMPPMPMHRGDEAADRYQVVSGDNLWDISGRSDIYANPYQWPLIYRANQGQIKDADLIFPGQTLDIQRNASGAEVNAAIAHAKNRGAWSLGVVEDTDRAYLAQ